MHRPVRARPGRPVAPVRTGQHVEQQRAVRDRPGHRADVRERAERARREERHPPVRRLDAEDPGERRRDADRAAAVGAERERAHAGGHRRRGAAAGAARRSCEGSHGLRVTPVSGLSVTPFQPNSGVVVLPTSTAPCSRSRATAGASSSHGCVRVDRVRAAQRRPAAGEQDVLDGDRHAVEQAVRLAAPASAPPTRAPRPRAPRRRSTRQNALTAVVDRLDAVQRGPGGLDRGQAARRGRRRAARSRSGRPALVTVPSLRPLTSLPDVPELLVDDVAQRPAVQYLVRLSRNSSTSSVRQPTTSPDMCGETITFGSVPQREARAAARRRTRPAPRPRSGRSQRLDQVVLDHELPAADVDQPGGRPHRGQRGRVEHAAGGVGQRRGQHHLVGLGERRRRAGPSAAPCRGPGRPSRARRPTRSTVMPAAVSLRPIARPIGPVPTTSARRAGDPLGLAVPPAPLAAAGASVPWQVLGEASTSAEHVLGDRLVEDAAGVGHHDVAGDQLGDRAAGRRRRSPVCTQRSESAAGQASRDGVGAEVPDEQHVGPGQRADQLCRRSRSAARRGRPGASVRAVCRCQPEREWRTTTVAERGELMGSCSPRRVDHARGAMRGPRD